MRFFSFFLFALFVPILGAVAQPVALETFAVGDESAELGIFSECVVDTLCRHDGRPTLRLAGFYPFASTAVATDAGRQLTEVRGLLRVDSLVGEVSVGVSMWADRSRAPESHLNTYRLTFDTVTGDRWRRFALAVPDCPQAACYDLTVRIRGAGIAWLADTETVCDGRPLATGKPAPLPASLDGRFRRGSGIELPDTLDARQLDNLAVLCRVWGFVKYYHPAVRAGGYDMDNELLVLMPRTVDASPAERNRLLCEWIEGMGTVTAGTETPLPDALHWLRDTERLGGDLSALLLRVAEARRTPFCYYAYTVPAIEVVEDRNEKSYPKMDPADDGLRMLAAFRLWNFTEYFYPYKELADRPWDETLPDAIAIMAAAEENRNGYADALCRIAAFTDDSHTSLMYRPRNKLKFIRYLLEMRKRYPYGALFYSEEYLDGKFLVTWAFGEGDNDLRTGDAIMAIDGVPVDEIIARQAVKVPASNPGGYRRSFSANALLRPDDRAVIYTVERDGEVLDLRPTLYKLSEVQKRGRASGIGERPRVYYSGRGLESFEILADSIAYVDAGTVTTDQLKRSLGYDRLILDLRNGAVADFFTWCYNLLPAVKPIASGWIPNLDTPGTVLPITVDWAGKGAHYRPERRIVVLVDDRTESHGEYCTMLLQTSPQVTVLGTQTAGADGDVVFVTLPGEYELIIGSLGVAYPDGTQCQRVGVRLDETVPQTLEHFRTRSDAKVERAVEIFSR